MEVRSLQDTRVSMDSSMPNKLDMWHLDYFAEIFRTKLT